MVSILDGALPKLKVGILNEDGSLSEVSFDVDDPREVWCRHWNELHGANRQAVPLAEIGSDATS
jgi:hypothetical protein